MERTISSPGAGAVDDLLTRDRDQTRRSRIGPQQQHQPLRQQQVVPPSPSTLYHRGPHEVGLHGGEGAGLELIVGGACKPEDSSARTSTLPRDARVTHTNLPIELVAVKVRALAGLAPPLLPLLLA